MYVLLGCSLVGPSLMKRFQQIDEVSMNLLDSQECYELVNNKQNGAQPRGVI